MPLIKSSDKGAVGPNIKAEMAAGRPRDQAIAIALNTQREAARHGMANGGPVRQERPMDANDSHLKTQGNSSRHSDKIPAGMPIPMRHRNKLGVSAQELMRDPYGDGAVSKKPTVANGDRKNY